MRRYQKCLLSVGLIALTPGVTLAGPLSIARSSSSTSSAAQRLPSSAQKGKGNSNQVIAERIAESLRKAKLVTPTKLKSASIKGWPPWTGAVGSPEQRKAAHKAAMVAGVDKVNNRLRVTDPVASRSPVQQAAAMRRPMAGPQNVRPVNFQDGPDGQPPYQQGMIPQAMPPQGMPPQGMPPQAMGPMGGMPAYSQTGAAAPPHAMYNQPNFPNNAWPSTAQYPNYAAVTYPTQYSASAWPYIGPFYPYPQVPLGWRKAQLEWDDGYWNLNFRPRTDRWWWFLDPKNW